MKTATRSSNASKPSKPARVPLATHRPGSIPVVTTAQLVEQASRAHPDYADGYAAGQRFAAEVATFADLERIDQAARSAWFSAPAWVRGFVEGAAEAHRDMGAECFAYRSA